LLTSRRYTQAATAAPPTQPSPATQKFAERLKALEVDKKPEWRINKKYPRVFLREETEDQRVAKVSQMLKDLQPGATTVDQLGAALELCAGIQRHPEKEDLVERSVALLHEHRKIGSTPALIKTIKFLGQLRRLPDVLIVAETIKLKEKKPNIIAHVNLIRACGLNGDIKKAQEYFNCIKKSPSSLGALVEAYARNGVWTAAKDLIFNCESEHNVKPTFRLFRRYLLQCVIQGEKSKGLAMLEYMKSKKVTSGAQMKWMETVINGPAWNLNTDI